MFKCSVFPSFEIKSVRNAPCIPSDFAKENKNGTKRIVFIWMDTKQGFLVLNYPKDNGFVRRLKNDQGNTSDCGKAFSHGIDQLSERISIAGRMTIFSYYL